MVEISSFYGFNRTLTIWSERNVTFGTAKAPVLAKKESGFLCLKTGIFVRESPVENMVFFVKSLKENKCICCCSCLCNWYDYYIYFEYIQNPSELLTRKNVVNPTVK